MSCQNNNNIILSWCIINYLNNMSCQNNKFILSWDIIIKIFMDKEIDKIKCDIQKDLHNLLNYKSSDDNHVIPLYTKHNLKYYNKSILVLSGGGIKGIAHIGALQKIHELGYLNNFTKFVGTSIGGLIMALLVIGYLPKEIWDFIQLFEFKKMVSLNILDYATKYGIDDGSKFEFVLCNMITEKNIDPYITLHDLYLLTNKHITFSGVSINDQTVHYISHETFPDIPLITAIRITTCIPIYFIPIKYTHNNKTTLYIDGGCMDNYPIHLYDNELDKVLGLYISKQKENVDTTNIELYMMLVFETFMNGMDLNAIRGYKNNTINIIVDNINSIDFGVNLPDKIKLYNKGYNSITIV